MTMGRGNHAIRSDRWRYIRYNTGDEELYDHLVDPWEHTNLAGDPQYVALIAEHRQWLPKEEAPGEAMVDLLRTPPPPGTGLPKNLSKRP